jgi:hypothetical protein
MPASNIQTARNAGYASSPRKAIAASIAHMPTTPARRFKRQDAVTAEVSNPKPSQHP